MIALSAVEQATPVAPESPYKGLVPFEDSELDALLFFGREQEREVIAANLLASRLTVLYGPSGVGKSSLLRAGVTHQLRREAERNLAEQGHPEIAVAAFANWSEEPVAAVRRAAERALGDLFGTAALDPPDAGDELADVFETWTSALGCELLLVLDQAEEYFLYHEREAGRQSFAEQLPELVTRPGLRVRVLLAVREDSLAKLDFFKGRIPNLFANYLRLDHLDRAAGRRAILGPVERYNELASPDAFVTIEPALVDAVLGQVETGKVVHGRRGRGAVRRQGRALSRVEAPYLQLVMQRLWEVERAEGSTTLRLATLERLGGASRITEEHLERALGSLTPVGRDVAALMFHHLVTPSGTKIAHRTADLAEYAHVPAGEVQDVVRALAGERILRPVDGRGNGEAAHEIFHDVLADAVVAWRTRHDTEREVARERERARRRSRRFAAIVAVALAGLAAMTVVAFYALAQRTEAREQAAAARAAQREALDQAAVARAEKRRADRKTVAAQRSERRARRSAREARVARRQAIVDRRIAEHERRESDELAAREQDARREADESTRDARAAEAESERERRRAVRLAALERRQRGKAVRLAALERRQRRKAVTLAALERRQRSLAEVGELVAQSDAALDVDPERSLSLALRAAARERSHRVEDALRNALVAIRLLAELRGGGAPLSSASFSSDGSQVVTAAGLEVRLYRGRSPRLVGVLPHPAVVNKAVFGPDGRVVLTAGGDGRARVWSVETRTVLHTLPHPQQVTDAAITADRRLAVTASADGNARVWEIATGLLLHTLPHVRPMRSLALSPDGRHVVTVSTGDPVGRVFSLSSGGLVAELRQEGELTDAAFGPAGDVVATTGRRNAYLWNVGAWSRRHLLTGHTAALTDVAFSGDGRRVLTTSVDSSARLYDVATGNAVTVATGHHQQRLNAGAVSPDGNAMVTASNDGTARLARPIGIRPVVLAGHRDRVTAVVFSPDGGRILTASDDGSARMWAAVGDPDSRLLGRHEGAVVSARFNARGDRVVSAGADGTARVWRSDGRVVATMRHRGRVTFASFTANGRVLTASADGTAVLWSVARNAPLWTVSHGEPILAAAVSRSGGFVTAGASGTARLWSSTGSRVATLRHEGPVRAVVFSGDGRFVATGGVDGVARIWRSSDGRPVRELQTREEVRALAFSPDGRVLVTGGVAGPATVWDVATGRSVSSLLGHGAAITSISFSRNGRQILTSSVDGDARSWTIARGRLRIFRAHVATVSEAAFSPDGRWVATAGPGAVGVFDARTGRSFFFVRGHVAPLASVSFAPDGKRILTASADGTVRLYRCEICARFGELRALAKARLARIARPRQ